MREGMVSSGRMAAPMRSVFVLLLGLLLALAACVTRAAAGDPPVPIEGKLLVTGWEPDDDFLAYFMSGLSDNLTTVPFFCPDAEMSPLGDKLAYWDGFDIWTADWDGTGPFNVSGALLLGGVNCPARWSPDATKFVFQHADPLPGQYPCEAGFHVLVANVDGTGDVTDLTPPGATSAGGAAWMPNGYRLSFWAEGEGLGNVLIDADGSDLEVVPLSGEWSPDGSRLAYSCTQASTGPGGEPGFCRSIAVSDPFGNDFQVIASQFVTDEDVNTYLARTDIYQEPALDPFANIAWWVGPVYPRWSPAGDRVAFIAAMPFDPLGPYFRYQDEVWVCDLDTTDLTQITSDPNDARQISWNGENTLPSDPEVTVDNTTVTFSEVTGSGLTTIIREDDPPALPAGYQFLGEYYNISTTAAYSGPITICMTYNDEEVPGDTPEERQAIEEGLILWHWDESGGTPVLVDITISRDPVNNIVCGQADCLSRFGLAVLPIFGGFRPPINADGSSEWKAGRTIPVKFMVTDPFGDPIIDATCHLSCSPTSDALEEGVMETAEAASADVGDTFRYDEEEGQYIYNLSTKGWASGAYILEVTVEGWPGFSPDVRIGLR